MSMNDMNDSGLWVRGFGSDKQLKAMDDMNDSESWDQGSKCFE